MMETATPALLASEFDPRVSIRKEYDGYGLKYLHSNVHNMLSVARRCDGVAYGGYVRDVVTRVQYNDFSAVSCKDVDIWFKENESRELFMREYSVLLRKMYACPLVHASEGTNSVIMALFDEYQSFLIYVDCVVSPVFPVYDLDVNNLIYEPTTKRITSMGQYELPILLNNIRNKECVPTPLCMRMLLSDNVLNESEYKQCLLRKIRKRMLERFVATGWKLKDAEGDALSIACRCGAVTWEKCRCDGFYEYPLINTNKNKSKA